MHELSESYLGGQYAYDHELDKVAPAIGINHENIEEHPVYSYAHSNAVETAQVRPYFYKDGKIVFENSDFEYIVWMVIDNGNKFNVQVFKNK